MRKATCQPAKAGKDAELDCPLVSLVSLGCCNKHHRQGGLCKRHLFLTVLDARSPRSRYRLIWFLVRPIFPALQTPSCCVLMWSFFCVPAKGGLGSPGVSSSPYKGTDAIRSKPYPMTSFNLTTSKGPISKYSYI